MPATTTTDDPLVVHVDVTDTVATHWRAGIQRVVAQLVHELSCDDRLRVVPVVWLESVRGFRTLTVHEAARLAPASSNDPPRSARAGTGAPHRCGACCGASARWPDGCVRRWSASSSPRVEPVLRRVRRWVLARTRDRELVPLRIELAPASVLFELDTVWNNTWVDRDQLYRQLRSHGVHLAVLVYDLLPQQHPEWFEASLVAVSDRTIGAQAAHAEVVLAISADTATQFARWAAAEGLQPPGAHVISLGADAAAASGAAGDASAGGPCRCPMSWSGWTTCSPSARSSPARTMRRCSDAFDRLVVDQPGAHLVVVGRPGWHNDEVIERLASHPELGRRLHWFRAAGDDLLGTLYAHARVVAVASITEGYGLPVIEAMAHGVPVVSSDGGALVEAGGDLVERVDALDVDAWVGALGRYLGDDALVAARRGELAGYVAPRWSDTGAQVAEVLLDELG